ncbi:MarR family winged helix-turn-helix transcriptional regulator [Cerasicoccus arenae]|uniref:MarR family transcriptional regulator n=1 Tax=Cerasicoccus arenae TaxID=424488 RepID=A0A8J3DB74_9BACT|nr:MarR family transcriptional regulator [Cerasicoccus arenae]MBK1858613.1 MarR family transcriptional regulator [Cerasicoccus arenae]GHC05000.1 MarR family transcriptional regulator [Cerasicoccus arenae]
MPPKLSKKDFELISEFRYTLRKFLGFSEAAAAGYGLSSQQYQALLAIEGFPGRNWVTVGELAEQLQIAHHSAVGLINRMEKIQLVSREKSSEDRRRVQVSLTPKGKGLLESLYWAHQIELKTIGPKIVKLLQRASLDESPGRKNASPVCYLDEIED